MVVDNLHGQTSVAKLFGRTRAQRIFVALVIIPRCRSLYKILLPTTRPSDVSLRVWMDERCEREMDDDRFISSLHA